MKTDARGPRITAHSFFQQLHAYGYDSKQLIHVVSELLDLITHSMRESRKVPEPGDVGERP
ncbi:hypothetical protein ACLESO_19035 [Pyxidicoccus sp. 3LG]